MGLFSSIIGAVAKPLAGGLVGKLLGDDEPQKVENRINFQQLRDDAQAAGFNPLTALQYTGGGGNVTSIQPPKLSTKDFIGEAVGKGVETWFNRESIQAEAESQRLRNEMLEAEIENVKTRTQYAGGFGYSIPTVTASVTETAPAGLGVRQYAPESGQQIVTETAGPNSEWYHNPKAVDAGNWEERYGEPGEWAAAGVNLIRDAGYTAKLQLYRITEGSQAMRKVDTEMRRHPERHLWDVMRKHQTTGRWKNDATADTEYLVPRMSSGVNRPPRAYYGPPGSRSGF